MTPPSAPGPRLAPSCLTPPGSPRALREQTPGGARRRPQRRRRRGPRRAAPGSPSTANAPVVRATSRTAADCHRADRHRAAAAERVQHRPFGLDRAARRRVVERRQQRDQIVVLRPALHRQRALRRRRQQVGQREHLGDVPLEAEAVAGRPAPAPPRRARRWRCGRRGSARCRAAAGRRDRAAGRAPARCGACCRYRRERRAGSVASVRPSRAHNTSSTGPRAGTAATASPGVAATGRSL